MEFLQQIHTLEETCSKHEIESQTCSLKNTKLEMRIQVLESEQNGTSEKLSEMEKENKSLTDSVREMSEKLKAACVEKINLEQAKLKLEIESESKFLILKGVNFRRDCKPRWSNMCSFHSV